MAFTYDSSIEAVVDHLAVGVREALAAEIKKRLAQEADKIVAEVAGNMANVLQTHLATYRQCADGQVRVILQVNTKEVPRHLKKCGQSTCGHSTA